MREVPFFNYPALFETNKREFLRIFEDVCSRGAYILQRDLAEFEERLREFLGVKYAFGVADGTNALVLGLRSVGIAPGDEVITPSHTYIASPASIHLIGAKPVLCDIGWDNLIDASSAENVITDRTRAIMPVHVNGRTCDMDSIFEVANRHDLIVVEDAAQALGSRFKDKCAGTFGKFGTFSFYPAKVLGCFGDGGAIVSNDDEMGASLGLMRDHGRSENGEVVAWGTNSRLDNLQAAFLLFKLRSFDRDIARRREIADRYHQAFSKINAIMTPPGPDHDPLRFDVYQNYEMAVDRRDELRQYLKGKCGISTIIQWAGTPVHKFRALGFDDTLPATEYFFDRCVMLPMNMSLSDEDVDHVIASVSRFYDE